jgi:antitoxin component of MazEF toxin-antitoxin module
MRTTTVKVQKWGDGLALRLPHNVVRDARLTPGQEIEVSCRGGIITMKPIVKQHEGSIADKLRVIEDRVRDRAHAVVSRMR